MTARQIIDRVNEIKPNAFSDAVKLAWLNELEGRVAAEIMLMPQLQIPELTLALTDTPMVDTPYDAIYPAWLCARIDEANGEYDKYNTTAALFNSAWSSFSLWFAQTYDPAQGYISEERRRHNGTL